MEGQVTKVSWTRQALLSLQCLYNFYSDKSEQAALNLIDDIIEKAESITFTDQYQIDEVNPRYRRMVVRHYKILYRTEKQTVYIMDVFDTRQSPDILRDK